MDDQLISRNNQIISEFKPISFSRRLKNELDRMYANYDQIDVEVTENDEAKVNIYQISSTDNQFYRYEFVLTRDYPFRPPVIFFQGRPYLEFLKTRYTYTSKYGPDLFRKVTGQNCFCCSSVNCGDNWSPGITLEKIIAEIHSIKKKKRDIINKILADKIKARHLIVDIDLDSWLY